MVTGFPHAESAVLDIRKLEDYCLNPSHPRGRHKARFAKCLMSIGATLHGCETFCCKPCALARPRRSEPMFGAVSGVSM